MAQRSRSDIEALRARLKAEPGDAAAANALGNHALAESKPAEARRLFEQADAADPGQPAILFNLAAACRATGDSGAALAALDKALGKDPYFIQALFQKAVLLEELGELTAAARIYRDFLDTAPPEVRADPRFADPLARASDAVRADDARVAEAIEALGPPPSRRIAASIAHLTGQTPAYRSEPTFLTVPELPSIPFLDNDQLPWLAGLEATWEVVRDEAQAVLEAADAGFVPYVANPPGTPLNQWRELDHNRDWGAFFLWRHGARNPDNCQAMPRTAALLQALPLLDIERRAPNAFLSRLASRTHIPAHNGVTNARVTVHLPLIVPPGCRFRVGGVTREWRPGQAWVFDDTIDHEAWNDSDAPRLILIFDVWNPLLGEDERQHIRHMLRAYDGHYGRATQPGEEF